MFAVISGNFRANYVLVGNVSNIATINLMSITPSLNNKPAVVLIELRFVVE